MQTMRRVGWWTALSDPNGRQDGMTEQWWTGTGNNGAERVVWETKRHPESGNSLSAYHHLRVSQMMDLPESTDPRAPRHPNIMGAV